MRFAYLFLSALYITFWALGVVLLALNGCKTLIAIGVVLFDTLLIGAAVIYLKKFWDEK